MAFGKGGQMATTAYLDGGFGEPESTGDPSVTHIDRRGRDQGYSGPEATYDVVLLTREGMVVGGAELGCWRRVECPGGARRSLRGFVNHHSHR